MINYKNELNSEQYDAVTTTEGPLLILAGAGSGKTRTLIYRVAYLIEQGVSPEQILLLTFTNKAANEMKTRAKEMLDDRCEKITACTYHSFCAKLLRKYYAFAGLSPNFTILDPGDCADVFSMLKAEKDYHKLKGFPPSSVMVTVLSTMINRGVSAYSVLQKKYPKYCHFISEVNELIQAYFAYKKENSVVDYDDLLVLVISMLKKHPDLCSKIEGTYQYIMVDEYQDSNNLQEQIVFLLRQNNRNLAVVGDDAQSIYGFRGSNVQNIISFPEKQESCKSVYLTNNYRSNQEILDLSNRVMETNMTCGFYKEMLGTHHKNELPELIYVDNAQAEAKYILGEIEKAKQESKDLSQICILVRNAFQSFLLESMLTASGFTYEKYGGLKFLDKEHVKDVLAFLRCLVNPMDEIAWYRVLQLHEGIGKVYAREIARECKDRGKDALLDLRYTKKKFYSELCALESLMECIIKLDAAETMKAIIEYYYNLKIRIITNMKTEDEENRELLFADNEENKKELNTLVVMSEGYSNVLEFLDDLSLDNKKENPQEALVISTIHSAKGLEFETVYIMDCIQEVCPSTTDAERGTEEDDEELRCFYVAMTRAKEKLVMLVPGCFQKYGQTIGGRLSHFLEPVLNCVNLKYI